MKSDTRAAGGRARGATRPRSHLFTVRVWKQDDAGGSEYRGSAREVISGAFCHFRDWSDLAAFMVAQVEEDEPPMGGEQGEESLGHTNRDN